MRAGKIIPTLIVPISEHKKMNYYSDEAIEKYAKEFNWRIIDNETKKELFMEYVKDINWITEWCDKKLQEYYDKLTK